MPPITILRLGTPGAATCARLGGYTDWIARHLSGEIRVVDILGGETVPAHDDCRAVILTGSAHMVDERQPWSEALRPWLQTAVARELPVFGICYGHQLLADALGGTTGNNPRGAENGNITLRRLPACDDDPLFAPLPPTFTANATHIQSVLRLPQGVQFHPEFGQEAMRDNLAQKRDRLAHIDAMIAAVPESTPHATALLQRFAAYATARQQTRPAR